MEVKEIRDVPRRLMLEFLESLDEELKTWRDFKDDGRGNRIWQILQPESYGLAAIDRGKVVGARYWFTHPNYPPTAGLMGAIVKKEYWNQGVNQMLHRLMPKLAREHGIEKFMSATDRKNGATLWSALKSGYRITSLNLESKKYNLEMDLTEGVEHES